ncbi:MAG: hypothetical protein JWR20_2306 [Marmoricola sp.]|nr:hypothetical protein [Marmoricola sp.]
MTFRRPARKTMALAAATSLLALPLSACSSPFGGGAPKAVASVPSVTGRSTAIKLDAGFAGALKKLKLTPGTVGRGKLRNGSLIFPITGGNVTVFKPGEVSPYVIGQLHHDTSGFSLAAGGTKVTLRNFNVDPGASRVYGDVLVNGKQAATDAYLFSLDGRTLKPLKTQGRVAILTGTKVKISPVAAPLLDKTFKTKAVKPGLLVGVATITVRVK